MGLEVLNKLTPVDEVSKLIHSFVNELVWGKPPEYEPYRTIFTSKEWSQIKKEFQKLKEACQSAGFCKPRVTEYLSEHPDIDKVSKGVQAAIVECFEDREKELHAYLLDQTENISGVGGVVKDVDWSVNLVLGSDTMSSLREPLLNLSLHTEGDAGRETEHLELSIDELKMLINSMDAAYKSSLQLI